jgi:hypothetical protein
MTQEHRMANWLFEHLGVDVALAGDILEEYKQRRSRVWLAKQVLVAVFAGVWNSVRDDKQTALRALFIGWGAVSVWSLLIGSPWQLLLSWQTGRLPLAPARVASILLLLLAANAAVTWVLARIEPTRRVVTLLAFLILQSASYVYTTYDEGRRLIGNFLDQPRFRPYLAFYLGQLLAMVAGIVVGGILSPAAKRVRHPERETL